MNFIQFYSYFKDIIKLKFTLWNSLKLNIRTTYVYRLTQIKYETYMFIFFFSSASKKP